MRRRYPNWSYPPYGIFSGINKKFIADVIKELAKNYKQKKSRGTRRSFRKFIKQAVLRGQNYRCKMCFREMEYPEFDHIDDNPSNNMISNCQALCPNCHAKKTRNRKKASSKFNFTYCPSFDW